MRLERCLVVGLVAIVTIGPRAAGQGSDETVRESAYAQSIAHVADSAIRRLDFFPARAQVRAQMLFLAPSDSGTVIFHEIARRSRDAALTVDELIDRFQATRVPEDLSGLHRDLLSALRDARSSLDRLSASASACQLDPTTTTRCQAPFTAASSTLAKSYARYLDVRKRIALQVQDTHTVLPAFAVAARRGVREP